MYYSNQMEERQLFKNKGKKHPLPRLCLGRHRAVTRRRERRKRERRERGERERERRETGHIELEGIGPYITVTSILHSPL